MQQQRHRFASRRRRRLVALTVIASAVFGVGAGVALAANVFYTPGTVGAGNLWADGTRHSYTFSSTTVDHTGCAGVSNVGGGIFAPGTYAFWSAGCTSGAGSVSGPVSPGQVVYGATQNPNSATTDHFGSSYSSY